MMKAVFIVTSLFLVVKCTGQNQFKIDYSFPVDTVVYNIDTIGKEIMYDVDFVNKQGQPIKNRHRFLIENHNSKKGYHILDEKTYYYYKDSLLHASLSYFFSLNKLDKTEYAYNDFGKLLTRIDYAYTKALKGDTLLKFKNGDYFLNHPNEIPNDNWKAYSVCKRSYNSQGKIIYKGYLSQNKNSNKIERDRDDYFVYNEKSQLIENSSLTRTNRGRDLMQTFEYDCNGKMIKRNWYEDGRYQAFDSITYTDSAIYCKTFYFDYPLNQHLHVNENGYSVSCHASDIIRYRIDIKTKKYRDERSKKEFKITVDAD